MILIPKPPARDHLRSGLPDQVLPCELVYLVARSACEPRVIAFRSLITYDYITRFDLRIPEIIKFGVIGAAITDLIEIEALKGNPWQASCITSIDEQPIWPRGRKPKKRSTPTPIGYRTFIYSR